jgi:hypothetical protein
MQTPGTALDLRNQTTADQMADTKLNAVGAQLERFATAASLDERLISLADLIKQRALHAAREDVRLSAGLEHLARLAETREVADDCLRAIAALARIGTVKSLTARTSKILSRSLEQPLPSLSLLKDPDDRYYVASALHQTTQNWMIDYAASAVVEEKQAEKSRQELVAVLFRRAASLAGIFQLLVFALKRFKPATKNPGDSVARRLERILAAIRPQAVSVLIEPGAGTGQSLHAMLSAAFSGAGKPETLEVSKKIVEEIAGLVHDIARTQISLVAESSLYDALDIPKAWFSPPEWRYIAEKSPNLRLVTRDIRDAVTLLAKQGKTDRELFEQLIKASGSQDTALKLAATIVEQHPDLDAETSAWLKAGGKSLRRSTLAGMEESRELSADPVLANLMMDGHQLHEALSGLSEDTWTELRLLEPGLTAPLESVVTRCRVVLNDVDALARKRNLIFRHEPGELVDYSQVAHELIGGHKQGIRRVRIVQPMIVREGVDGAGGVVRKALVEKV